jgi:hypothetical protein
MARRRPQTADRPVYNAVDDRQVVLNEECAELESDVVVRAETHDIRFDIGTVVRAA